MPTPMFQDQDAETLLNVLLGELDDVGLLTWNGEGVITSLSHHCKRLLQLPDTAGIGEPVSLLRQTPCADFMQRFDRFAAQGAAGILQGELTLVGEREAYWLNLSVRRCPKSCGASSSFMMLVRNVTNKRQMIASAQQAQDLFEAAFQGIPDAAVLENENREIINVSTGMASVFGYSANELLGKSARILYAEQDDFVTQGEIRYNPSESFSQATCVLNYRHKNRNTFLAEGLGGPLRDRQGRLLGYISIIRDISERLEMENDLREQTDILDSIFRQLPFALSVSDTQRRMVQGSDAALALFGYTQEELAGQPVRLLYADDRIYEQTGKALYESSKHDAVIAEMRNKSGNMFKAKLQSAPLYDADKKLKGYLTAMQDVTEELARVERQRLYEQMVSASTDALVFIDDNFIYRAANDVYLELWQKRREEVIGVHISKVVGDAFFRKISVPSLAKCFAGEVSYFGVRRVNYPAKTCYVEVRHDPYRNEQGAVTGALLTIRDVTHKQLAEQALRYSEQRLNEAAEFAGFALWEVDVESRRIIEDLALRRLLGYSAADKFESLQDWFALIPHEAERIRVVSIFEALFSEAREIATFNHHACKQSGESVAIEVTAKVVEKAGHRRVIGMTRDISEKLREQERLRLYEEIVSASKDPLVYLDCDGVFRAVNQAYCDYWHKTRSQIEGQPMREIVGQSFYTRTVEPLLKRCCRGESFTKMLEVTHLPDGYRYIEAAWSPFVGENLKICGAVVSLRDATEKRRINAALRESEAKFRAIFDHAPIGMGILNAEDCSVMDVNPALLEMHGYTREAFFKLTAAETAEVMPDAMQNSDNSYESVHHHKDAGVFDVLVNAKRIELQGEPVLITTQVDISHQKKLEEKLRAQERQYRSLVESTSAILFSADPKTFQFNFVSQEAEAILGYPAARWVDEPDFWLSHMHPQDKTWAPDYCLASTHRQQDHEFDYRMIASDGREVWLHDITSVVVEEGEVVNLVGVMFDVTAQKAVEEELRRLSEMVEQSVDAILLTDTDFKITYVNEAFRRLYGYVLEELQGLGMEELSAEDEEAAGETEVYRLLHSGQQVSRQMRHRRKDASRFVCHQQISPMKNEQGEIIAFMSSQRDISVRVKAEKALRHSEEKYRQIVETAHEGIWVIDGQSNTVFVNQRMTEMLGYPEGEMMGESLFTFMDQTNQLIASQKLSERRQGASGRYDLCFQRRDGEPLWVSLSANPLFDDQGDYIGAMAMISDISEARKLQQALISTQRMEAVGQLTGGIAHDFNNILGSILGFTELARDRFADGNDKLQEYLQQIEIAGDRARNLVRQLLIFSRGDTTASAKHVMLAPLVKEILKMLRPMLPAMVEIRTQVPQHSPSVRVDPLHIQQLLMNLCINARDAMPVSGAITIGVGSRNIEQENCALCRCSVTGEWVSLRVSDSGPGIPQNLIDDIFQPFVTSKDVGEGSGMGLAVVRGIVETYGGHLLLDSNPDQGATFEILLPPYVEEINVPLDKPALERKEQAQSLKGRTILVIDDEVQIQIYLSELLKTNGAEVVCYNNGIEVLENHRQSLPGIDLIICDQGMPGISGTEFVQTLRSKKLDTPVILSSGYNSVVSRQLMEQLKIACQLEKPLNGAALIVAIQRAI